MSCARVSGIFALWAFVALSAQAQTPSSPVTPPASPIRIIPANEKAPTAAAPVVVKPLASGSSVTIRILARVGDTSISNRELLIEWLLKNPKSYVSGRRDYYTSATERELLNQFVVQVLVEEENRIVGTQTPSSAAVERSLLNVRRSFGTRWKTFLEDFGIPESDVKTRLTRDLLVSQTLETRLRDSLQSSRGSSDEKSMQLAEESLQNWLQQLRSRYKAQIFRYDETKSDAAP